LRYLPNAVGRDVSSLPVSGSTIGSDGSWYTCAGTERSRPRDFRSGAPRSLAASRNACKQ